MCRRLRADCTVLKVCGSCAVAPPLNPLLNPLLNTLRDTVSERTLGPGLRGRAPEALRGLREAQAADDVLARARAAFPESEDLRQLG